MLQPTKSDQSQTLVNLQFQTFHTALFLFSSPYRSVALLLRIVTCTNLTVIVTVADRDVYEKIDKHIHTLQCDVHEDIP